MRTRHVTILLTIGSIMSVPARGQTTQATDAEDQKTKDLARRLLQGDAPGADAMSRVVDSMSQAETRLARKFDPGAQTQSLQRKAIEDLDKLIAAAIRGRGGSGSSASGDVRRRPSRKGAAAKPGDRTGGAGGGDETKPSRVEVEMNRVRGSLRETGRGWGNLPARDRDEVVQGSRERSLEKFRTWIERYYKALAEDEDR